jgi:hypothetical protein
MIQESGDYSTNGTTVPPLSIQIAEDGKVAVSGVSPLWQILIEDEFGVHLPTIESSLKGIADLRAGARPMWRCGWDVLAIEVTLGGARIWLSLFPPEQRPPDEYMSLNELETLVRLHWQTTMDWQPKNCLTCGKALGPEDKGLGGDCSECMDASWEALALC